MEYLLGGLPKWIVFAVESCVDANVKHYLAPFGSRAGFIEGVAIVSYYVRLSWVR